MTVEIRISLISHTNVGKTSLARTLLRRDIGEVGDEAHLTEKSEHFVLMEDDKAKLILWDTPGFGPVGPILKRLRQEGAWAWLKQEIVDKVFNRALYSSVEAARHVGVESDVVVYLVNARELPEDAGYVSNELALLDALGKPVVMALNQNPAQQTADERTRTLENWRACYGHFDCVKEVLRLDSVHRSWRQEMDLLLALAELLVGEKRTAMLRFAELMKLKSSSELSVASELIADIVWFASQQVHDARDQSKKDVVKRLSHELEQEISLYVRKIAELYGIDVMNDALFRSDLDDVVGRFKLMDERQTGLWSGAIAGASTGLVADVVSGGMSFGGGFVVGALLGAFGGHSLARVLNATRKDQARWHVDALWQVTQLAFEIHRVAAHHGRGGGKLSLTNRVIEDQPRPSLPDDIFGRIGREELDRNELAGLLNSCLLVDGEPRTSVPLDRDELAP